MIKQNKTDDLSCINGGIYHEKILNHQITKGFKQVCIDCGRIIGYTDHPVHYPLGYKEGQLYE